MRTLGDNKQIRRIREGIGPNYRQVLVVGEEQYRDVRMSDILFDDVADQEAWSVYGPQRRPEYIDLFARRPGKTN